MFAKKGINNYYRNYITEIIIVNGVATFTTAFKDAKKCRVFESCVCFHFAQVIVHILLLVDVHLC